MKKEKIIKVAFLGLVNGLLISSSGSPLATEKEKKPSQVRSSPTSTDTKNEDAPADPNSENLGYHLMTEDELLLELNDEGTKQFMSLSSEGKALARQVASARCQGTNTCKGLNACESEKNKCAGKGSCKGTGKCGISDKNLAVRIVAGKMAQKRNQSVQGVGK